MSKTTRCTFLVLVVLLGSICVSAAEQWVSVRSPNFEVITNGGEKKGREVLFRFEQMRALLAILFSKMRIDPGQPIIVMAFRDEKSFKPFATKDVKFWVGFFQQGQDKHYMALRTDRGEEPFRTIFHEYMHLVLSLNIAVLPRWLDEGLAEFYAYTDIEGTDVLLGKPSEGHIYQLRESKFLPVEELFQVDYRSPHYNESNRATIFYAESWTVVHWLMLSDEGKARHALAAVIDGIQAGKNPMDVLRSMGLDARTLNKKLENYVERFAFPAVRVKLKTFNVEKEFPMRPLEPAEVEYYAGDLLLHTHRFPEAVARFNESLELKPDYAPAMEGLGLAAIQNQQWDEAEKWLEKAVVLEAQNFLTHYHYASLTMRRLSGGFSLPAARDTFDKAKNSLRRAIELRPNFAPALQMLASLMMIQDENLPEAQKLALKALQLEPRNVFARTTLAQIYARQEKIAEARQTIQMALSGASPEERPMLEAVSQQIEMFAERLVQREAWKQEAEAAARQPGRTGTDDSVRPLREETVVSTKPAPPLAGQAPVAFLRGKVAAVSCDKGLALTVLASSGTYRLYRQNVERLAQVSATTVEKLCHSQGSVVSVNYYAQPTEGFDGEAFLIEFGSPELPSKPTRATAGSSRAPASSAGLATFIGSVEEVRCGMPMVLQIRGKDRRGQERVLRLRAAESVEFYVESSSSLPPRDFNPCESKGLNARATYRPLADGSDYDGELTRIDFLWKGR